MRTLLYYLYEEGDEYPCAVQAEIADTTVVPDEDEMQHVKQEMLRKHALGYFNSTTHWYVELQILKNDKVIFNKTST